MANMLLTDAIDAHPPCESPIESQFLQAWMDILFGEVCLHLPLEEFMKIPPVVEWTPLHCNQMDCVFTQQSIGKYRVDFMLGRYSSDFETGPIGPTKNILIRLPLIVVECDGHDFHEKTKEQARKDKSRDRFLVTRGYRVLRFTGSEIHQDAESCAQEVDQLFRSMQYPNIKIP